MDNGRMGVAVGIAATVAVLALAGCGPRGRQGGATSSGGPAAPATAPAAPAGPGGLADGEYDCGGGYPFRAMGKVDIQGATFRYRPLDEAQGGFAPYTVDADGTIHWGGPFPGIDEAPAHVTVSSRQPFGFNVSWVAHDGGMQDTMSCHAPGK
jgi:hypothetical protein